MRSGARRRLVRAARTPSLRRKASRGRGRSTRNPEQSGFVEIHTAAGGCSGALLRNNWAVTAGHCLSGTTSPSNVSIVMGSQSSLAASYAVNSSADVAVVMLKTPFKMNNSTTGFVKNLNTNPISKYQGSPIICYGYGEPNYPRLRSALMISGQAVSSTQFLVTQDTQDDSLLIAGDSGGVCEWWDGTILGVQSLLFGSGASAYDEDVIAANVAAWVNYEITPRIIICPPSICGSL